ncbi:MAG: fatty acid desaturase, partial [Pseudomonas sp.]
MSNYLDETQRREIEALAQTFTARTEWPTWLLLIGVYA